MTGFFDLFRTRPAGPAQAEGCTPPEQRLQLPPETPKTGVRDWQRQLDPARRLIEAMRGAGGDLALARQRDKPRPAAATGRPQPLREPSTRVAAAGSRLGLCASLDAHWIGSDTVLHDVSRDPVATALTYLQEDVRRLVDLRTAPERVHPECCLDGDPYHGRDAFVAFERQPSLGRPPRTGEAPDGPTPHPSPDVAALCPDMRRQLLIPQVTVADQGLARDEQGLLTFAVPGRPRLKPPRLLWWQVPLDPRAAIRPDLLRALMDDVHQDGMGGRVAFTSPGGDRRAAVAAAAWQLHQRFHAGRLDRDQLEDAVMEICLRIRLNRDATLLGDPADVATLLAYGEQMLLMDRPRNAVPGRPDVAAPLRRVRFQPIAQRVIAEDEVPTGHSLRADAAVEVTFEPKAALVRLTREQQKAMKERDAPWEAQVGSGSDIASSR